MDRIGLLLDPAFGRLVDLAHLVGFMQNHVGQSVTIKPPALVFLEKLDLFGKNDRIIDAIWVHVACQVAQIDPVVDPPDRIVATVTMDFEYSDDLPVLPNFDAMLQGFDEDRIVLWQPLDERKWNASTIGKDQGLVGHLFDKNRVIQGFGIPEGDWRAGREHVATSKTQQRIDEEPSDPSPSGFGFVFPNVVEIWIDDHDQLPR